MEFNYDHIVNDLKFKVTKESDNVFEKEYGIPYKMIELWDNGYGLSFDQIKRTVKLYKDTSFVKDVESLEELHGWCDVIKLNIDKTRLSIVDKLFKGDALVVWRISNFLKTV